MQGEADYISPETFTETSKEVLHVGITWERASLLISLVPYEKALGPHVTPHVTSSQWLPGPT